MATAYKCDMTGKLVEGEGIKRIDVAISPTLMLEIIPHNKIAEKHFGHGVLSPEAAERIRAALSTIAEPEKKEAQKSKG